MLVGSSSTTGHAEKVRIVKETGIARFSEEGREDSRHGINVASLDLIWVVWKERTMRNFEGVENDAVHVRSGLVSLDLV